MPVDATKIHQGPGHLWLDVSVPTTGARLLIDATGTPTAGSPLYGGAIEGATTFNPSAEIVRIEADQISAPIDHIMTGEEGSIEVEMKESDLAKLRQYMQHGTYATGTDAGLPAGKQNYEEITFGGIIPMPKYSVAVVSPRRDASGKFVVGQLYQAVQMEAIKLAFTRKKETTYKVKFDGEAVTTRPVGDQVGKLFRQP